MTLSDTNNSRSLDDTQECDGSPKKGVSENFEQDVVDYCSSSEKDSEGRFGHLTSSNSANSKKEQSLTGPENETPIGGDPSDESDFLIQEHSMNADNPVKFEGCMHGTGSSQVNESLQIPVSMTNRKLLDFDLNEVYSEDTDLISVTDSVAPISSAMLPAQDKGRPPLPSGFSKIYKSCRYAFTNGRHVFQNLKSLTAQQSVPHRLTLSWSHILIKSLFGLWQKN